MSDAEEKNDKRRGEEEVPPTAGFGVEGRGPGGKIGQFRIESELGRGGMGVVYLAHDTKLDRQVAIKNLPPELIANPDVRSHFSREARILASLNHPNIATIYEELEEGEGASYLILEYVPGDTLSERIVPGGLKLEETLSVTLQIAEAVAAAHEKGIIHRDLKPGNIKITPEGKVKVLDFGIARTVSSKPIAQRSTVTELGRIIGTPAYMSPEQVRGQEVDRRSDIWSFGCVLYEMLTGRVPFEGETGSDTLAGILEREPEWQALSKSTPTNIQILLRRCLEKDRRRRLQHIGDAAIEISETLNVPAVAPPMVTLPEGISRPAGLRRPIICGAACLLFGAIAAVVITYIMMKPTAGPSLHIPVSLPPNQMMNEADPGIAVSPDGKRLVYVSGFSRTRKLILREFDQFEGRELPETNGALYPFFKPDGQWIGFQAGGKLKKLSLDRGRPEDLCDASILMGGSWSKDGVIYFCPAVNEGLWKVSDGGGTPERVTEPNERKDELGHWWPEVLPGGKAVLFTIFKTSLNDAQVAVLLRETGEYKILVPGASNARYARTGHLLYARSGTLTAVPFDPKRLKPGKPEQPVIEGLNQIINTVYAPFCFSTGGLLYYVRGGDWLASRDIVWVDRHTGDVIERLPLEPAAYLSPRLSPDTDRQSFAFRKFDSGAENIWVYDSLKGPPEKVTFEGNNFFPIWKPDDNTLTFTTFREGPFDVYWKSEGMNSPVEAPLVTGPNDQRATSWSPDGKVLLFHERDPNTGRNIWCYSIEDGNDVKKEQLPKINTSNDEYDAVFHPDGNWIAYSSTKEEGQAEVYVASYPEPVVNQKISTGGEFPVWSHDGNELFYRSGNKMMAVTIESEPEFKASANMLFDEQSFIFDVFDVSHDGQRFLMIKSIEEEFTQLVMVPNFFEELKRKVPRGKK